MNRASLSLRIRQAWRAVFGPKPRRCRQCGAEPLIVFRESLYYVRPELLAACRQLREAGRVEEPWGHLTLGACTGGACASRDEAIWRWNARQS